MLRFTLRDLLWLILVAALVFSWYRTDRQRVAELESTQTRLEKWRTEFQAESTETIAKYDLAARNPGAYQDWLKHSDEERAKARQIIAAQLGLDDEKP